MDLFDKQVICLKFCVTNNISYVNSLKMLQKLYKEHTLSKSQLFLIYNALKEGQIVDPNVFKIDIPISFSSEENIKNVKELIMINSFISVYEIAEELHIPTDTVQTILVAELGMTRVGCRIVPRELNLLQKVHRKNVAEDLIEIYKFDPTFRTRIITGGEMWFSAMKTENGTKPLALNHINTKVKVMMSVYFDWHGLIHSEFIPPSQALSKEYYLSVMARLRENIIRKRPKLWMNNSWFLHHERSLTHSSILMREFLTNHSTNVIDQPPCSPDMIPTEFYLFPRLEKSLNGKSFETNEALQQYLYSQLNALSGRFFRQSFPAWNEYLGMVVNSHGAYIREDSF